MCISWAKGILVNKGNQATVFKHLRLSQCTSSFVVWIHDAQFFGGQMFPRDNIKITSLYQ